MQARGLPGDSTSLPPSLGRHTQHCKQSSRWYSVPSWPDVFPQQQKQRVWECLWLIVSELTDLLLAKWTNQGTGLRSSFSNPTYRYHRASGVTSPKSQQLWSPMPAHSAWRTLSLSTLLFTNQQGLLKCKYPNHFFFIIFETRDLYKSRYQCSKSLCAHHGLREPPELPGPR